MSNSHLQRGLVLLLTTLILSNVARGQDYPNRPIRIVTGGAGGGNDVAARLLGQGLTTSWGQQVVIDNRPSGVIPGEVVVKASPDGYVLLLPEDPDRSARELREALRLRLGVTVGVVITDTLGRPWRTGQVDAAIGATRRPSPVSPDCRRGAPSWSRSRPRLRPTRSARGDS